MNNEPLYEENIKYEFINNILMKYKSNIIEPEEIYNFIKYLEHIGIKLSVTDKDVIIYDPIIDKNVNELDIMQYTTKYKNFTSNLEITKSNIKYEYR